MRIEIAHVGVGAEQVALEGGLGWVGLPGGGAGGCGEGEAHLRRSEPGRGVPEADPVGSGCGNGEVQMKGILWQP